MIAFGLALVGLVKVLPLIAGIGAIVASVLARRYARDHEESGIGFASVAFLVGIVDVLVGLVWLSRGFLQIFMENGVKLW
jgi:hypothetical protein